MTISLILFRGGSSTQDLKRSLPEQDSIEVGSLTFHPRFPLASGVTYNAVFHPPGSTPVRYGDVPFVARAPGKSTQVVHSFFRAHARRRFLGEHSSDRPRRQTGLLALRWARGVESRQYQTHSDL